MLRELQEEIAELLKDHESTAGLEIITEDRGDLLTKVKTAMAKLGLCVVVEAITARVTKPNMAGPVYDDMSLSIVVTEQVMMNRAKTDRTAQSVADEINVALHQVRLESGRTILCGGVIPQEHPTYFVCSVPVTLN